VAGLATGDDDDYHSEKGPPLWVNKDLRPRSSLSSTDSAPEVEEVTQFFHLRRESVVAASAWLDQLQANWDEQLDAFRAHIERRTRQ
jgi:hypothetical protein